MYVVIIHRVKNGDDFNTRGQEMNQHTLAGIRPLQFLPSTTFSEAVCLWEGPDVDTVRRHVDGSLGDSAENTYFEVAADAAVGLPSVQNA